VQFSFVRRLNFLLTLLLALSVAGLVNSCGNSASTTSPDPSSRIKISTSSLPNGQIGAAYSTTLAATGGVSPYTWSLTSGSLPAGLTLNASTGAITGTPSASVGSTPLTFKVTDSSTPGLTQTATFTLTISPASLAISTSSLPNGQTGVAYSATLAATGGVSPYTWSLTSGFLPAGLTLNASTGAITGTPSASVASTPLTFKVADASSPALTQTTNLTLTISATPTVASVTLNPTSVLGGNSSQGTVTLSGPALSGGATVTLTSSNTAAAQVPASVVVPAVASSATFAITTSSVSSSTNSVISASFNSSTQTATLTVTQVASSVAVLTYHNDSLRTGQNVNETILTTANVNSSTFGKLFSLPVDGPIFAQPLYLPGVTVGTQVHNLVFVATEHNSVYAWDADTASATPVWNTSLINSAAGVTAIPCGEAASGQGDCTTITPEFGITSTPVIDSSTGTLYVVASTKEVSGSTTSYVYRLHALSVTTGQEKFGGPVVIQATSGSASFDAIQHIQRPALLLVNGVVYVGFGSHGDTSPWYGWLLGYNASTLQQVMVFNTAPVGGEGAIWQSGCGPAADASGNIYFNTGNGPFDVNTGGVDYGDSIVKLNSSGTVQDYFTPYNQATLEATDSDVGSSGLVLLPDQTGTYAHVLIGAGKQGVIYSVNRDGMGQYNAASNQNIQSLAGLSTSGLFGSPAYWNGNVYFAAWNDYLRAFQVSNGTVAQTSHSSITLAFPGATPSVSSNGTSNGIVWIIQENVPNDTVITNPPTAVLRAYDATNLANELYDSTQAAGNRDAAGGAVKFAVPTIANGKVYVGNSNQLTIYGLLP
jgi:Putative Ig domain